MINPNVYIKRVEDIDTDHIGPVGRELSGLVNGLTEHLLFMNLPGVVKRHAVRPGTEDAMSGRRSIDSLRKLQGEVGKGAMRSFLAYSKTPVDGERLIGSITTMRTLPLRRQLLPVHHRIAELAPGVTSRRVDPHEIGDNLASWFDPRRDDYLGEMASALLQARQQLQRIRPDWTVVPTRVFEKYPDFGVALATGGYNTEPDDVGYYYDGESDVPPKSALYITQPTTTL